MAAVVALAYRTGEPGASDVVDGLVSDPLARVVQPRPLSEAALAGMLGSELGEEVDRGSARRAVRRRAETRCW